MRVGFLGWLLGGGSEIGGEFFCCLIWELEENPSCCLSLDYLQVEKEKVSRKAGM